MVDVVGAAVLATLTALVVALGAPAVLRRLPEPTDGETSGAEPEKTPYACLAAWPFVTVCVGVAVAAQLLAAAALPAAIQPLWAVLATGGVLLAAIDARTTWLPLRLTHGTWWAMAGAALVSVVLGAGLPGLIRTASGAAVAGGFYLLVWVLTRGGFGFGDVRFAPLLGAATASHSWGLLLWGLTLGTAAGALHGGVRLARRRRGGFPYAPSMLLGCYLAVLALWIWPGPGR
jgi:leader peptidase (prepilin peptidase)/N-methyltransferase